MKWLVSPPMNLQTIIPKSIRQGVYRVLGPARYERLRYRSPASVQEAAEPANS